MPEWSWSSSSWRWQKRRFTWNNMRHMWENVAVYEWSRQVGELNEVRFRLQRRRTSKAPYFNKWMEHDDVNVLLQITGSKTLKTFLDDVQWPARRGGFRHCFWAILDHIRRLHHAKWTIVPTFPGSFCRQELLRVGHRSLVSTAAATRLPFDLLLRSCCGFCPPQESSRC